MTNIHEDRMARYMLSVFTTNEATQRAVIDEIYQDPTDYDGHAAIDMFVAAIAILNRELMVKFLGKERAEAAMHHYVLNRIWDISP